MMMAAQQVLKLLDSFWFETTILTNKTPSRSNKKLDEEEEEVLPLDTKLQLDVRFYSDQNLASNTSCVFCDSPSPKSQSRLRTIPSGREIRHFSTGTNSSSSSENHHDNIIINTKKKQSHSHHGRSSRLRESQTRSLSELEFKELKGFMDLGFVFSEEDKDSELVSLIPGLQRLGREEEEEEDDDDDDDDEQQNVDETTTVSSSHHKPYLSEAWGVLDQRGRRNPLQNWSIPERGSEIDMKLSLRFWAHTVASSVR